MKSLRRPTILAFVVGVGVLIAACSSSGTTSPTTAPKSASLLEAVTNTLSASGYSELLSETTAQGQQTDHLTFRAPDRLGGYIQSGSSRTYIYVIGSMQYQSQAVPSTTSIKRLRFQSQTSQGATELDPAHGYLPYATQANHPTHHGNTYSFTLTKQSVTGTFTYTVKGQYVSKFTLSVPGSSVRLNISAIGKSPRVVLPSGANISSASSTSITAPSP